MKLRQFFLTPLAGILCFLMSNNNSMAGEAAEYRRYDQRVADLLARMTLAEKVGQMTQINGAGGKIPDELREAIESGEIGSILNEVDVGTVNELQRIATEDSRLGIPLLMGRDVIHGFRTVLPIPLGQAATWNPELVARGSRVAALEAVFCGPAFVHGIA